MDLSKSYSVLILPQHGTQIKRLGISTGRVSGNIETDSLVIFKGGFFNGNVSKIRRAGEVVAERRPAGPALVETPQGARKPA